MNVKYQLIFCGLAFIIVNPIPGQEERNATHLLENGVAIRGNNMNTIAYKLQKLLSDDARLATLKNNARTMARPQAARDVATQLLKQWSAVNRTDSPALPIELAPTRRGYLRHLLQSANRAV